MKKITTIFGLIIGLTSLSFAQDLQQKEGVYYTQDGQEYTGNYSSHYPSGEVMAEYNIEKGLLNKEVTFYHENGAVKETGFYANGKKDGTWIQWNQSGKKTAEAEYIEGTKNGIWTIWDDEGNKRYHMVYDNGEKIDVWKMWDDEGNLISERLY